MTRSGAGSTEHGAWRLVPGLLRLRHYEAGWLRPDVLAGVGVAAYLIPQVMAYAVVAGLPAIVGFWAIGTALLVYAVFGSSPQLNLWVRSAPRGTDEFCWHVDVLPRITVRAGFELGTGVDVNVYPPERAAADLRDALGDDH